jgi:Pretoxin HINT domain
MKRLALDARGSVYVASFIAFLPVFVFFLATLQLADASVAQLVVDHASAAAARAAAVVLPDDGPFYEDRDQAYLDKFDQLRRDDVELAADLILRANPRLEAAAPNVNVTGSFSDRNDIVATVTARYGCLLPGLCGGGWTMKDTAALVFEQGEPGQTKPVTPDGRPTLPIVGVTDDQGHLVDYKTCFVAGTKITTPEDARAIETIAPGDAVFAYDEASKEVVMAQVVRTFSRKIDEIFDLTIRVPGGAQNTITGTGTHPFYVLGRGYVQLKALTVGNKLLTFDGSRAEVIALASRKDTFAVYNFEVAEQHNYFVQGANEPGNAVLVHNICPPISKKEEKKDGDDVHAARVPYRAGERGGLRRPPRRTTHP